MNALATQPCILLPWDTEFFGFRIARAFGDTLTPDSSRRIDAFCREQQVRCLYFVARSDDTQTISLAEENGYHLVDVRMTLEHKLSQADAHLDGSPASRVGGTRLANEPVKWAPGACVVRPGVVEDLPELRRIARANHIDTRFYYDPRFPRDRSAALYETWIQSSFDGMAAVVFVVEHDGKPAGYVACRLSPDGETGSLGLIAVDAPHQGRGFGRALVDAAIPWFAEHGARSVSVVTQGRNVSAQRLYARAGFIARDMHLYYHRWFTPAADSAPAGGTRQARGSADSRMHSYRIPFNRSSLVGKEQQYILQAVETGQIAGDQTFTKKCHALLEQQTGAGKVLATTSCTHALEMTALLLEIAPGDEVIVPSFTFVSTINAFVLRGAKPVFVDVRPDTLNLDETKLAGLITRRTKAIVPVHYAGVGCEMDSILATAAKHNIPVVEDNAHGLYGRYRGKMLGTFGCLATQSFHETKNVTCGEGGALLINDSRLIERAEVIREKGTNRSRFFRGQVDKYSWVDVGSSYLMSDLLAAFLFAQLECAEKIRAKRRWVWEQYDTSLSDWAREQGVRRPIIPLHCEQAYHMYYLLLPSLGARQALIAHLKRRGILAVFHYLPLHVSDMGRKFGGKPGDCPVTEDISDRLLRLPFYNDLSDADQADVIDAVRSFTVSLSDRGALTGDAGSGG